MSNGVYFGHVYSDFEIKTALDKREKITYRKSFQLETEVANYIADGNIVGWFQGGSEYGPRALGNRSILADPRKKEMKDLLNAKVKFREFFRPFAPSVLWEYQTDFFELNFKSPYMLIVSDVKKNREQYIPAVTHVDGTARVQTVLREENPRYYRLIEAFYKITGIPALLDTSFNIKGEPIVESPDNAIDCFLGTQIDILVLDKFIIQKERGKSEL